MRQVCYNLFRPECFWFRNGAACCPHQAYDRFITRQRACRKGGPAIGREADGANPRQLLAGFVRSHLFAYGVGTGAIIASEFVIVQFPHLLGRFTDALSAGQLTPRAVGVYAARLAAVGLLYVLLFGVGQFSNGRLGREFEYELRQRLFSHWETLSTAYYHQRSVGDLLNHALNDVRTVREAMAAGLNQLTNAVFLLCSTLWMTLRTVDVRLTLASMFPLLFVPVFVVAFGPRIRQSSRQVQERLSDMADLTEESLTAIRLIKATGNEPVEARRFAERVEAIVAQQMQVFQQSALFQSLIPLMGSLSFAVALVYGGALTATRQIGIGEFVAFTQYLGMMLNPLQQIGNVINNFQRASASLLRLEVLLAERPDITDPPAPVLVEDIRGAVAVHVPEFRYPGSERPVLRDVHFEVAPGQTVGIVGRTGSGKTTLVNLLPRIFDPPPGTVFIDGHDVRNLRLSDLRGAIAYVPQDGFLFSTTIGENIAFAREGVKREEVEQAARLACIDEDIARFPDGYDTVIGERGVTLSGGQRQRTAIARALLKDAPILILDDSLSAVDMNTEKRIIEHLRALRGRRTTFIVAHRLSAVRDADLILVLDEGRVVERGTHEALLAQGGIYAAMYALQAAGEGVSA